MNELATRIHGILAQHTIFATPILTAQCKYMKKTPDTIDRADLPKLSTQIARAVALFSNPGSIQKIEEAIRAL
jgi:hypothetical protein